MNAEPKPLRGRPRSGHGEAWRTAKTMERFGYADLAAAAKISPQVATNIIRRWLDLGLVRPVALGPKQTVQFEHVPDAPDPVPGVDLPVDNDPLPVMWAVMRGLVTFSVPDLLAHIPPERAIVTEAEAKRYVSVLLKAGYLQVRRKAVPGVREAIYRLIRNTGPLPPVERRTMIVQDPNLEETVYVAPVRP
jgi:hypothetical protein